MTLITYPTRVHFADGVLEEALRSELERRGRRHPLLVAEQAVIGGAFHDRVLMGLPRPSASGNVTIAPNSDPYDAVKLAQAHHHDAPFDVIIAFGTTRAIEIGRKCRRALSENLPERLDLFAIPGVDGLPDPCTRNLESWRMGLPSILICDPTLTLGADRAASQAASVLSLARCLESYLALSFNPTADGMALDGFLRCIRNIPRLCNDEVLDVRRDLMAACLNAMLAQEKGIGPAQVLARALGQGRDIGAIARLILPGVLAVLAHRGERAAALCSMMGGAERLEDGMRDFLAELPLNSSLSDMGLGRGDVDRAVAAMAGRSDMPAGAARQVLEAVF